MDIPEKVKLLNPQPGDVLVWYAPKGHEPDPGALAAISEALEVSVVVLPPGQDLDVLDAEAMALAGWVRAAPKFPRHRGDAAPKESGPIRSQR